MKTVKKVLNVLNQNLAVVSVVMAVVALLLPAPFVALGKISLNLSWVPFMGQHFPSLGFVNILLGIIMFGMGMTLKTDDFLLLLKRPKDVLVGVVSQYVYMAGFGFLVAQLFRMSGVGGAAVASQVAVGLVLLGCVPGGTASNVMTFLAHGDVALSVTMTMCTTLLAPVLTPYLTLMLAGQWIAVDFWNMFFSIVVVVFLPIVLGIAVHALLGEKAEGLKNGLVAMSTVCIMLVLGMCVAPNRSAFLNNGLSLVLAASIAVLAHHVLGLVAGYFTAKLFHMDEAKVRAMSLEVGLQNSGLACSLASTAFPNTMVVLPCVLATVIHQVVGPMVANLFARRDMEEQVEGDDNLAYTND